MEQGNVEQSSSASNPQASEPPQSTPPMPVSSSSSKKPLIIGGIILGFLLFGVGGYMLGMQRNSQENDLRNSSIVPTQSPTTAVQASPTSEPVVTEKPITTTKPVTVPTTWKKYTSDDQEFGIKTSMAMPPGYSFRFTGSESTIQNDSDATELWDYSSSVYRDNDGVLKNHYDGSSRRAWYEKRLAERQSTDKIVSVKEKPLNSTNYLEITVQTPAYDDHGVASGTKNGFHYVYVQNGILHMITPASNKAYTAEAQIPENIEPILASLTSVQTK
jgi:hypothetical protein